MPSERFTLQPLKVYHKTRPAKCLLEEMKTVRVLMRIQYTCMTKQSHPKTLGAISFIILTEPFVTLQCDQELRRISFEDYGSEITKITIHIYPPFPYRSMSCIKSMYQISCKCKIVNRRRTTTNLRQPVIWVTQASQVNQSFY